MSAVYSFIGIVGLFLLLLAIRWLFYWIGGIYDKADRYWSLSWEKPEVERENITDICHRLRIPPPGRF